MCVMLIFNANCFATGNISSDGDMCVVVLILVCASSPDPGRRKHTRKYTHVK